MTVQATIYRILYFIQGGKLCLRILGRDTEGKRVDRILLDTKPYFYCLDSDKGALAGVPEVVSITPGPPTMGGKATARVDVRYPFDVPKVKSYVRGWNGEADILFELRTRIDYGLTHVELPDEDPVSVTKVVSLKASPQVTPRMLHWDIEVNDAGGRFARPSDPTQPVLSVAFFDSTKQAYGIIYDDTGFPGPIDPEEIRARMNANIPDDKPQYKVTEPIRLFPFHNEHDLLGAYGELLGKLEPDIASGWNDSEYDAPYISGRANRLLPADPGSPDLTRVFESFDIDRPKERYHGVQRQKGRYALIDCLAGMRKIEVRRQSYALEAVAQKVLGFGKIPRPPTVAELRATDPVGFLSYNAFDVLLTRHIDRKKGITAFYRRVAEPANVSVQDVPFNMRIVDGLMLTEARISGKPEMALPSKEFAPKHQRSGRAAEVFDTVAGTHLWVVILDLAQEYPSVDDTLNISPETLGAPNGEPAFRLSYPDGNRVVTGGTYRKSPPGLMPRAIRRIRRLRTEAKAVVASHPVGSEERKAADIVSQGLKFIVNSLPGVLGSGEWRMGNVSMFEDITGISRGQLIWNKNHVEDKAWLLKATGKNIAGRVILGDTDSVAVVFHHGDVTGPVVSDFDEVVDIAKKVRKALNESYVEYFTQFGVEDGKHSTEVDIEGIFGVLKVYPARGSTDSEEGAKKRYVGRYDWVEGKDLRADPVEGRTKHVGVEIKRWNNAALTREIQTEIVRLILTERPLDEIQDYVAKERAALLRGERNEKLWIPTRLTKDADLYGRVRGTVTDEDGNEKRITRETAKPPFVRAMMNYSRISGAAIQPDEEFRWTYVRNGVTYNGKTDESIREFAVPYTLSDDEVRARGFDFEVDLGRLVEKCLDEPSTLVCPELDRASGPSLPIEMAWG